MTQHNQEKYELTPDVFPPCVANVWKRDYILLWWWYW